MGDITAFNGGGEIDHGALDDRFRRIANGLKDALYEIKHAGGPGAAHDLADLATRQLDLLIELFDELAAAPPAPAPAVSTAGVITVPAAEVRPLDRLLVDLDMGHHFPGWPAVYAVERAETMVALRVPGFDPWWATAGCRMLIERPPADPPPPEPAAEKTTVRAGTPRLTEESAEAGIAKVASILDEVEGRPEQPQQRSSLLWLPPAPLRRTRTAGAR